MRLLRGSALVLGLLGFVLWLASYSWLLGLTPPTRSLFPDSSPWFVAEAAAVPTGALALALGLGTAWRSAAEHRRVPHVGAALGGFAMVMSLLSITAPS